MMVLVAAGWDAPWVVQWTTPYGYHTREFQTRNAALFFFGSWLKNMKRFGYAMRRTAAWGLVRLSRDGSFQEHELLTPPMVGAPAMRKL